ncbi:MAG: hypothetical protein H6573_31960 [Lewinellaceae bacterium]|nr:hypothetical protein [Lewinellaceae bacterium]
MGRIGWIDFSATHRERVNAVLDFLQEEGTIDELGIGAIRNALSDFFFPGISTIQTRAKYFFIIPRIIRDYQWKYKGMAGRPKLSDYLREKENRLIRQLAKQYQGADEYGIIGITLANAPAGKELARKPSSIYWNGLRVHGIIRTPLTLNEYLRKHEKGYSSIRDILQATGDSAGDDRDAGQVDEFGIDLPNHSFNWEQDISIELTKAEAEFLRDKMVDTSPWAGKDGNNLLRQVLLDNRRMELFIQAANFQDMARVLIENSLPQPTIERLHLALDFDQLMHGAHIRYNCLVQNKCGHAEKREEFEQQWEQWREELIASEIMQRFNIDFLLNDVAAQAKPFTRLFIKGWFMAVSEGATNLERLNQLVKGQEVKNKGKKARLHAGTQDAVRDWVGIRNLQYRFFNGKTIVADIKNGLNK